VEPQYIEGYFEGGGQSNLVLLSPAGLSQAYASLLLRFHCLCAHWSAWEFQKNQTHRHRRILHFNLQISSTIRTFLKLAIWKNIKTLKSTLRLPGLKARACSGLTLSGASLPRLKRRGLAPSMGQFLNILWIVGHIAWPITLHWRRNKKANSYC